MKFYFNDEQNWFFERRFGLFIHWGIYSINGWHEQEQYRKTLSRKEYSLLKNQFNPTKFNPDEWLDIAIKASMQYICFTVKHIDGFCMWNTAQTDFNIKNTPYGKDTLKMLAEACQRKNFPLCIYYSIPDMHCKYYPNHGRSYELPIPEKGDNPDINKYIDFVKKQIRELCTSYGKIHGFWWDGNLGTLKHYDKSVNSLIRSLQPGIIINNRGFDDGDFSTPERENAYDTEIQERIKYDKPTEACESIGNESWGYRSNEDYFSTGYLTRNIDKHLAKGGNYLLNVGPMPDGSFPQKSIQILKNIGRWYNSVKEAFISTKPEPAIIERNDLLITRKDNILYIHLCMKYNCSGLFLEPLDTLPQEAIVLNNKMKIKAEVVFSPTLFKSGRNYLHIFDIPVNELANEAIILKLEF